ncbi:MAG TPA: hypothetical protein VG826_25530 [Pirellulales bacterium]|nr:hypothetical protein [Pirellulales bacterium]
MRKVWVAVALWLGMENDPPRTNPAAADGTDACSLRLGQAPPYAPHALQATMRF